MGTPTKVRTVSSEIQGDGKYMVVLAGPSGATKPTGNYCTGSIFHEVDTKKVYAYIEDADEGSEWVEQMTLGGGS